MYRLHSLGVFDHSRTQSSADRDRIHTSIDTCTLARRQDVVVDSGAGPERDVEAIGMRRPAISPIVRVDRRCRNGQDIDMLMLGDYSLHEIHIYTRHSDVSTEAVVSIVVMRVFCQSLGLLRYRGILTIKSASSRSSPAREPCSVAGGASCKWDCPTSIHQPSVPWVVSHAIPSRCN